MSQIPHLDEILAPHIPTNAHIVHHRLHPLTQKGDNYGSTIVAVDVTLRTASDEPLPPLHLAAKLHPLDAITAANFNTPETFKKEIQFYSVIAKILTEFSADASELFPKFFGARLSLNPDALLADEGAVLLLENLKTQGYAVGDRISGFDAAGARFVVRKLAAFHALPVALKVKRPETFRAEVLGCLGKVEMFGDFPRGLWREFQEFLIACVGENEEVRHLAAAVRRGMRLGEVGPVYGSGQVREPFATIVHNDFWVNNVLLTVDRNGAPLDAKIIDFQMPYYGSPAIDLVFFLFSSANLRVLDENIDELIDLYFDEFTATLKGLGVDLEPFERELFDRELALEAPYQLEHILGMFRPIFLRRDATEEEMGETGILGVTEASFFSEDFKPKIWQTVREFRKRSWLT